MSYYSQHTPGYEKIKLGSCTDTLWQSACFLTSFCNLGLELEWFSYTPVAMNKLFTREKLWGGGCLLVCPTVAKYFGLTYAKLTKDPGTICIAETNKYAPKVPQHFFVYEKGMILDPLDQTPAWKPNKYPIVSYRVFKKILVDLPPKVQETQTPEPPITPPVVPDVPKMQESAQDETEATAGTNVPVEPPKSPETDPGTGTVEPVPQKPNWAAIWRAIYNFLTRSRS